MLQCLGSGLRQRNTIQHVTTSQLLGGRDGVHPVHRVAGPLPLTQGRVPATHHRSVVLKASPRAPWGSDALPGSLSPGAAIVINGRRRPSPSQATQQYFPERGHSTAPRQTARAAGPTSGSSARCATTWNYGTPPTARELLFTDVRYLNEHRMGLLLFINKFVNTCFDTSPFLFLIQQTSIDRTI